MGYRRPKGSVKLKFHPLDLPLKEEEAITIKQDYNTSVPQELFSDAIAEGKRVAAFVSGRRSGKTYALIMEIKKQIYFVNPSPALIWIISPSYQMSRVVERMIREIMSEFIVRYNKMERIFYFVSNQWGIEFQVELKTADDPDKLRGASVSIIGMDEAAMFSPDVMNICLACILDCKGKIFISSTPMGKNWLYTDVFLKSLSDSPDYDSDYIIIKGKTIDNIKLNEAEVSKLRRKYSGDFARQELDAEFITFERLVWKDFDPQCNILKSVTIDENYKCVGSIDFGYNDPCIIQWWVKDKDGRWFCIDENKHQFTTISEIAEIIKNSPHYKHLSHPLWADPSGAGYRAELQKSFGIETWKADNRITEGIMCVTELIRTKKFFITERCLNFANEIGLYQYDEKGEKPVDLYNHSCDACRYAILSETEYNKNNNDGNYIIPNEYQETMRNSRYNENELQGFINGGDDDIELVSGLTEGVSDFREDYGELFVD